MFPKWWGFCEDQEWMAATALIWRERTLFQEQQPYSVNNEVWRKDLCVFNSKSLSGNLHGRKKFRFTKPRMNPCAFSSYIAINVKLFYWEVVAIRLSFLHSVNSMIEKLSRIWGPKAWIREGKLWICDQEIKCCNRQFNNSCALV